MSTPKIFISADDFQLTMTKHQSLDINDDNDIYTILFHDIATDKIEIISVPGGNQAMMLVATWITADEPLSLVEWARLRAMIPEGFKP